MSATVGVRRSLRYLKPTPRMRELALLNSLSVCPSLSQRRLAQAVGLSPSVVNSYLARFLEQGLIEKKPRNDRDFQYRLTPKGRSYLAEMTVEYMRETFLLFSQGKRRLAEHLADLQAKYGFRRVALYSAGEVTELVIHALAGLPITLVAVVDDDSRKQGGSMFGHPVVEPEAIPTLGVDAVIVTTFRYRRPILEKLRGLTAQGIQVIGL